MKKVLEMIKKRAAFLPIALIATGLYLTACDKDEHKPPTLVFKTGSGYVSANTTLTKNDTIKVGVTGTKTEDELKTFNVSYAYDGATTTTTLVNESLTSAQEEKYDKDVQIVTRNQAGKEKYSFVLTDKDGNIQKLDLEFTVQ